MKHTDPTHQGDQMSIERKMELLRELDAHMKSTRKEMLARFNEALAPTPWNAHELAIMDLLHRRGAASQNELSQKTLLDPAAISRLVAAMRTAGYLSVDVDPNDRRARVVNLTEEGTRLFLTELDPIFKQVLQQQFDAVEVEELEAVLQAHRVLAARLNLVIDPDEGC